MSAIKPAVIDT